MAKNYHTLDFQVSMELSNQKTSWRGPRGRGPRGGGGGHNKKSRQDLGRGLNVNNKISKPKFSTKKTKKKQKKQHNQLFQIFQKIKSHIWQKATIYWGKPPYVAEGHHM